MNSYNKVFILGLDGLEYNFVEKWNLTHLKQLEYSKIKVPVNKEKNVPITPEAWAAFLTGKYVRVSFVNVKPPLAPILNLLKFIRKYVNLSLGLGKKIRENVPMKWWTSFRLSFPPLKEKTFLDFTNSKKINAPYYNYDNAVFTIFRNLGKGKFSLKKTIKMFRVLYEKRKKQILCEVEKEQDANIIFAYMHFPDALQHLLVTRPFEIKKLYIDLNSYVSVLKSKIKDSTLFLIVSDHGFDVVTGTHSKHGFYSSNMALNPKPKQITDFYKIILHVASNAKGD